MLVNVIKSVKENLPVLADSYHFLLQLVQTFTNVLQNFTVVDSKNILPFTDLPTCGLNFKICTAVKFHHIKR
jgi:hypothetical protein